VDYLDNPISDTQCPAWQIAVVDALAHGPQVRLDLVEVGGKHLASSTKARHNFDKDKQDVLMVTARRCNGHRSRESFANTLPAA